MKAEGTLKVEREAATRLTEFLREIPNVEDVEVNLAPAQHAGDFVAHFNIAGRPHTVVCEVKSTGQPRFVRDAINQLIRYAEHTNFIPVVAAPYLSEQSRQLCRDDSVGYFDFEGNALIAFDTVYIERQVPSQPKSERRALRSLFKPKSTRILRVLLRKPERPWRVTELATAAEVSVGLVSKVGNALRNRDWAEQGDEGLILKHPDGLLDAWVEDYEAPERKNERLYTHLHGGALNAALREVMAEPDFGRVVFASYSAAEWLAPYGRNPNHYLYADAAGLDLIRSKLQLSVAEKGGNILVWIPSEDGVLADAVHPLPDVACTSPVQTYLDLMHSGDRGREAAHHLREELLKWR
jgi:hypothetical protein